MKILSAIQTRQADEYTIKHEPIASIDLMERASKQLCQWYVAKFPPHTLFDIFVGPGNNGGDGLALARMLAKAGYKNLLVYLIDTNGKCTEDNRANHQRLLKQAQVDIIYLSSNDELPRVRNNSWVVDAILGSGLTRPLDGFYATLVSHINKSSKRGALAIDIPSGLFAEPSDDEITCAIEADVTLTFQQPKLSFMFAECYRWVGSIVILPIGLHRLFLQEADTQYYYTDIDEISNRFIQRSKFSHKGNFGHGLMISGSYGMLGAAILATKAALRAGAGLITAHIPHLGYHILQSTIPEAIASIDESEHYFTGVNMLDKYQAVAIGPGLNTKKNTQKAFGELLQKVKVPMVIDADGLNILAENPSLLDQLPKGCILTPHPKEFDRIFGQHSSTWMRCTEQVHQSKKRQITIVLKGAHTSISFPDGRVYFNSTGNSGMATGGSGDVLTGIVLGLLCQGYSPEDASLTATFIHGLAGDIAADQLSRTSLIASDIIEYLGQAFKKFEKYLSHA